MLKNIILWLGGIAVASFVTGCSTKSHHVSHEYLGHIPNLKTVNDERNEYEHKRLTAIPDVKNIGEATLYATAELEKHSPALKRNVIVTSLVDVDDFRQSSDFGRLFSDSMITNFKRLGWNVIDYRGRNLISQTKKGEFYLDRNELKGTPKDSVVFVGTYGHYEKNGLLINVRLLDKATNYVLSASNLQLNDKESYALSSKSNCKDLNCNASDEGQFNIMLKEDDCKNSTRCECKDPNKCLGEKEI
jgi:TolB-like protein